MPTPTAAKPSETSPLSTAASTDAPALPRRVASVDALRALVMFTMLFVNDVAGVKGIPWWMEHYKPYDASGMTFVDLVFPAFLFLVGMSIPLALQGRISRGEPTWKLIGHILVRGASLLLMGVFMVNMPAGAKRMGWPHALWEVLTFTAILAAFHSVPWKTGAWRWASAATRAIGFAALAYLAWAYQSRKGGHMHTSWWGILGLIGWAYMIAALIYLPLRRWRGALLIAAGLLLCVWVLDHRGTFDGWRIFDWVGGTTVGSQPAITMAGVALATLVAGPAAVRSGRTRFALAGGLAVACAIGAILLHDAYGINKNNATPSWCLWSVAITTALWMVFHAALDLRGAPPRWAAALTHAGGNALLAYVLSDYFVFLLELTGVEFYWKLGASGVGVGITRSLVFATLMLTLCGLLDRSKIRLRV